MHKISIIAPVIAAALLLVVVPAAAYGCNIDFRTIGPVQFATTEVKRPAERAASRKRWKLDATWFGSHPELNQIIRVRGKGMMEGVSFSRQRALSIDAAAPADNGWLYGDDADETTPPCAISGMGEWQRPVILVRQERREVRITAVAQRTSGSREGCVLGGNDAAWGCPTLTRTMVRLSRPIGSRRLVFETLR